MTARHANVQVSQESEPSPLTEEPGPRFLSMGRILMSGLDFSSQRFSRSIFLINFLNFFSCCLSKGR